MRWRDARPKNEHAPRGKRHVRDTRSTDESLTGNQIKILAAAIIGDALEFFDYFLIGFVLAFLIGPWKLTFGQSAIVLMSSGIGAIIGAYAWGWLADRIGRRKVFIGTVLNFSIATGLLYFTPDNGWIYLAIMRFFVGVGVGGLYCVDLPLVQEFMPSSKRGWVGGLVTCVIPLGVGLGAVLGAMIGSGEWRLLFAVGVLPALLVLLVRLWVPESPRWLCRQGRYEEARKSLAWALQMEPSALPMPTAADAGPDHQEQLARPFQISAQPDGVLARQCRRADRRLRHHAVGAVAVRAAAEGDAAGSRQDDDPADRVRLRRAALVLLLLGTDGTAQRGRPARLRRRRPDHRGGLQLRRHDHGRVGVLADPGGHATSSPTAALPSSGRTRRKSGRRTCAPPAWARPMASAASARSSGRLGLALIVGSGNYLKPDVPLPEIPLAFVYLGCWFLMAGAVYYFLGIETRGKSIEQIDRELAVTADLAATASGSAGVET